MGSGEIALSDAKLVASVGVVIPLYNHEDYIAQAVESVLAQGTIVRQVLVIDDGSRDNSLAAARAITDERVRVISQENAGAHATINRGIAELDPGCDWVAILNSDDYYYPGRLQKCVSMLQSEPQSNLVVTALDLIDDDGVVLTHEHPRYRWYRAVRSLFNMDLSTAERLGVANFAVTTSNFVVRRSWFNDHQFRNYRYVHDYRALLDAAFADSVLFLDEALLAYRVHASNTIDEGTPKLLREVLRMNLDLAADYAEQISTQPNFRRNFSDYQRMAWSSISSYRQDVMQCLNAGLAARVSEAERKELVANLSEEYFPELKISPNKRLVNKEGKLELPGETSGLAERLAEREAKYSRLKEADSVKSQIFDFQQTVLRSRWLAFGRIIGALPGVKVAANCKDQETFDRTIAAIGRSLWVGCGKLLGSKGCRQISGSKE